jgi:uncharacterized protein with PIN domain
MYLEEFPFQRVKLRDQLEELSRLDFIEDVVSISSNTANNCDSGVILPAPEPHNQHSLIKCDDCGRQFRKGHHWKYGVFFNVSSLSVSSNFIFQ